MPIRVRMRASSPSDIAECPARMPTRSPERNTAPLSGTSSQLMQRSSVDLPAPEGPRMQTVSPSDTESSMPSSTRWSLKDLHRPVT